MAQWVVSTWCEHPRAQDAWEVVDDLGDEWEVKSKVDTRDSHFLPKSEYEPFAMPEQWEKVGVTVFAPVPIVHETGTTQRFQAQDRSIGLVKFLEPGYRVASLVVERRKP